MVRVALPRHAPEGFVLVTHELFTVIKRDILVRTQRSQKNVFGAEMFWRTHHTKPDPKSMQVMPHGHVADRSLLSAPCRLVTMLLSLSALT
jgi:hypothetical protein